ncbi:hypothetical protein GCM10023196_036120 [Actinoallomurus vinaceus]|uniref:Uncharacterized protein n=1 Tax=Actinoallomurus vinaceus TaxID=1080074 RepID=A0ABP8U8Z9_9ACTN
MTAPMIRPGTPGPIATTALMQQLKEHTPALHRAVLAGIELGDRAAAALVDVPPVVGWHLVARGDRFVYRGNDASLWGEPGEVIGLTDTDFRCRVRFDTGSTLGFVDEHGLSFEGGAR